jgi:hypothetical protein
MLACGELIFKSLCTLYGIWDLPVVTVFCTFTHTLQNLQHSVTVFIFIIKAFWNKSIVMTLVIILRIHLMLKSVSRVQSSILCHKYDKILFI